MSDSTGAVSVVSPEATLRSETTYLALRQAVLSCALMPGSTVTEAWVIDRYGVSKSTCRLAMARLAQDGLVRSVPRQGYVVVPITLQDIEELFGMRLALEPAAARLAAGRIDADALLRIEQAARRNTASQDAGNRIGFFLDGNREFHATIAHASGNDRMARAIVQLLEEMKRLVALGFVEREDSPEIADDHGQLIEALRAGDADRAGEITHRHIATFRDMTLEKVVNRMRHSQLPVPVKAGGAF